MTGIERAERRGRIARYTVFGLMMVFLALGAAFALGETFADPGGTSAVLMAASWVVPAVGLSIHALGRPDEAQRVLRVVTAVVAAFVVLQSVTDLVPSDEVGPVATLAAFATSVPLAFLALHRAGAAGTMLLVLGLALALGAVVGAPAGSATAVAAPLLLFGMLFMATDTGSHGHHSVPPTAPASPEASH